MLRRTQTIASRVERDIPAAVPAQTERVAAGRSGRGNVGAMQAEIERAFSPGEGSALRRTQPGTQGAESQPRGAARPEAEPARVERRKTERRGMDALRDEALRTVISRVEDRNFGGLRDRLHWNRRVNPSRILLLAIALAAGGLAAFFATQRDQAIPEPSTQPATEVVEPAGTQILVAKGTIGVGQRLSPALVEWADWPQGAVRPEHITIAAAPEAITQMAGSVARFEFFPGEPIREQKLAPAGPGFLSALLGEGMRGVSVSVAAESASGGFIVPNDRVDVLLTRASDEKPVSETVLRNVRVLAIDARLGNAPPSEAPAEPEVFAGKAIATLELDPGEAEVLVTASAAGELSLVLRSILDFAEIDRIERGSANQAIRMSSPFWLQ